jgi:HEAT repeat protein
LLEDDSVRVREAAVTALGVARADDARDRMVYLMENDPWPFVRVAAAHAVASLPAGPAVDNALVRLLENDTSPDVRRAALRAIGDRHAVADVDAVRDRFSDGEELPGVRAEAALSLGLLCDQQSLPALTDYSHKLASPTADEVDRLMGKSSLTALALIHPKDLDHRLAPLRDKSAPAAVRLFALTALHTPPRCPLNRAPPPPR